MLARTSSLALHMTAGGVIGLTLIAVAQPLFAEDTWWHLSMGRAYASAGVWLEADPVLFTAEGPPAPAAWLSSLALHAVERAVGFQGLRVAHVAIVASILVLAWSLLRRVSASAAYASGATALFCALSGYRLFQLRPDLVSILLALLIGWWLSEPDPNEAPATARPAHRDAKKIGAVIVTMAIWANAHAGFVLGPILLTTAIVSMSIARGVTNDETRAGTDRIRWVAWALLLGLIATLLNPAGASPHLLYFTAGDATPELSLVADEWRSFDPFHLPVPNLPPSGFSWAVTWFIVLLGPWVLWSAWRERNRQDRGSRSNIDPVWLGISVISLVAMLAAVRFSWMAVFALIAIGDRARVAGIFAMRPRARHAIACGFACAATAGGFYAYGAWPMISKGVRVDHYAHAYPTTKNQAHAVWFLRDTGLEGRLYNDYSSGNFLGYWLAPGLRAFINGSLNVPKHVMEAGFQIERRAFDSEEPFTDILDRYAIDVFFAKGVPRLSLPNRPVIATTAHLEATPGWLPIFRSLSSAVYLRTNDRNHDNLARVSAYYEQAGVPFDAGERGFEVDRVIREAPAWATAHGLIPHDLSQLEARTRVADPTQRGIAREHLAGLFATIGLYERAAQIDRETLRVRPREVRAARRLVWSLLRQQRPTEAEHYAKLLTRIASPQDEISRMLIDSVRHLSSLSAPQRRALVSVLPMMSRGQSRQLGIGIVNPEVRPGPGHCELERLREVRRVQWGNRSARAHAFGRRHRGGHR
ncbi:MAG: hypothetical protein GY733_23625 [bacterium]|nr:hypothetical protein [bacterium]